MGATSQLVRWLHGRLRSDTWSGWSESAYRKRGYQQRLLLVQEQLAQCVDTARPGTIRILSMFAGDGRDVLGVLGNHQRQNDVVACLIEQSSQAVDTGTQRALELGLESVATFRHTDATDYEAYRGLAPADLILLCGVWGHVPSQERPQLIQALASLCAAGGMVIWTRGISKGMKQFEQIEGLFTAAQWEPVQIRFTPNNQWAVATHRYYGTAIPRPTQGRIFHFQTGAGMR
jgi:hypothetical protein